MNHEASMLGTLAGLPCPPKAFSTLDWQSQARGFLVGPIQELERNRTKSIKIRRWICRDELGGHLELDAACLRVEFLLNMACLHVDLLIN